MPSFAICGFSNELTDRANRGWGTIPEETADDCRGASGSNCGIRGLREKDRLEKRGLSPVCPSIAQNAQQQAMTTIGCAKMGICR